MKLLRLLRLVFSPFKDIAKSLERIADLYEMELGERNPPIMRRTEKPRKDDTEVIEDETPRQSILTRWRREAEDDEYDG